MKWNTRHKCAVAVSCLALCLHALPSLAAPSPKQELEKTQKDIKQASQKQSQLTEEKDKIEAELKKLQASLVKLAESVQETEQELADLEEKLHILQEQLDEKSKALEKQRHHLSSLVQAALALSHTPPEAMIMMPGDVTHAMKTARALKMTSESIRQEVQILGLQMSELQKIQEKVAQHREEVTQKKAGLDAYRETMAGQLKERTVLQQKINAEHQKETDKLTRLAKKAQDLKELIAVLEKEEEAKNERARAKEQSAKERNKEAQTPLLQGIKKNARRPAAGPVIQEFASGSKRGSTSKGITIRTLPQARVIAPFEGEVVFTGRFLGYGQMVILRHSDDFHTLLAGLSKIDVATNQFLLEGEPIGAMGKNESGNRLYIELRKNNQPINPAAWIQGLEK